MSADTAFYWISIAYLVVLIGSSIAAVRLWLLNDAYELGAVNRPARRTANMAVLSLAMIGAFASVVLFFLSQAINARSEAKAADAQKQTTSMALEIARIKAPRSLSADQAEAIKAACAKFPGTKFDMAITQSDPEAEQFQLVIENILKAAKWQQMPWSGYGMNRSREGGVQIGDYTTQNIHVFLHTDLLEQSSQAAATLIASLEGAGIPVSAGNHQWSTEGERANPLAKENIHVVIGRKMP